jgi:DNA-binding response OmpR family regulator
MAVDVVHDGAAALELAAKTAYDVLVLDRDLPVVHGDRVCRELAGSGPPILVLTAAGDVEDRVDGLALGADDYLGKPFAFAELVARVRALPVALGGIGRLGKLSKSRTAAAAEREVGRNRRHADWALPRGPRHRPTVLRVFRLELWGIAGFCRASVIARLPATGRSEHVRTLAREASA